MASSELQGASSKIANAANPVENNTHEYATQNKTCANNALLTRKNSRSRVTARQRNAGTNDGKLWCMSCSAILTNAETLNRTGSYSHYCRRCIEILSTKRQRLLIDTNRLQCKDSGGVNDSLCSYSLNSIESSSNESSDSNESDDGQEDYDLKIKAKKNSGIVRRSPINHKPLNDEKSNAMLQVCNEELKENRNKSNDSCGAQEQMSSKFGGTISRMNEEEKSKEGNGESLDSTDICASSKSQKRKASLGTESPTGRPETSTKRRRVGVHATSQSNEIEEHAEIKSEIRRSGRTKYIIGQSVNCRLRGKWEKATIQAFLPDGRISVQYLNSKETKEVTRAYLHDAHSTPPSRMWTAKVAPADKRKPISASNNVIDLTNSSSSDESDENHSGNESL